MLIANVQVINTIQSLAGIGRRPATEPLNSFLIVSRSHVETSLELALQSLLAIVPELYIARFYTNDTSEPYDLLYEYIVSVEYWSDDCILLFFLFLCVELQTTISQFWALCSVVRNAMW